MLSTYFILFASGLHLAAAHFAINYPYWRGDSFQDPASQWIRPCTFLPFRSGFLPTPQDPGSGAKSLFPSCLAVAANARDSFHRRKREPVRIQHQSHAMASERRLLAAERPSSLGLYVRQSGSGWRQHHHLQHLARRRFQPDRKRNFLPPDRQHTGLARPQRWRECEHSGHSNRGDGELVI